jgi:hypothetical protein
MLVEDFSNTVLVQSAKKIYYVGSGTFQTLTGPSGNDAFTTASTSSVITTAKWNNHVFLSSSDYDPVIKIYNDGGGVKRMRTAGMPALASAPTAAGTAGTLNFLYAFHYSYEYYVGTVKFLDYGAVREISAPNLADPSTNTVTISVIPVISNGATYSYDTASIKVKIYRTLDGGDTFYYIGEVTNGTTSFLDTYSDATIQNAATLYTTGGVLDNDSPPRAKVIHVADGYGWYGNIRTSGGEILTNRLYQSKNSDIDSVPSSAFVDLEDEIIAISSFGLTPIVLCTRFIYRLDGRFDDIGGGAVVHQKIDNRVGCLTPSGVVQVPSGICWAAQDGFYFSDGFKVIKLSDEFNETFKDFVVSAAQQRRIYAAYEDEHDRVYWAVQSGSGSSDDCDKIFVADLRWGVKPDACFTTWSNGEYFSPTALLFRRNKEMIRADKRGYLFKHNEDYLSDPLIDTLKLPGDWDRVHIPWEFKHIHTSFGTTFSRKFTPRVLLTAQNKTNVSIQIKSNVDVNKKIVSLTPIRFRKNLIWGDPILTWDDPVLIWNYDGIIEEQRRMSAGHLRCSYRQMQFANAYVIIVASDDMTTATANSSTKQVVLDDIVTYAWPDYMLGHTIKFDFDNYEKSFVITARGADTLTVLDPNNELEAGSHKWEIWGYPKDEVLNLLSFNVHFSVFGKTQQQFRPETTGENE